MSAVRLARASTRRTKVLKFEGCYHGHSDGLLAKAGSGLGTFGIPESAGVPDSFAHETVVARYNDLDSVKAITEALPTEIACILVEPVAGNMGVVPPKTGFLEGLRQIADGIGALLIFDEVITGFRIAWGGAQEKYGVSADLTTLGKIIGGGLPIGAFGGGLEIMEQLAPIGPVYQAGTLSGNPVAVAAGATTVKILKKHPPYAALECLGERLEQEVTEVANQHGLPLKVSRLGSMFTFFFSEVPIEDYATANRASRSDYAQFFRSLLDKGILLPPSSLETAFLGVAHTAEDIGRTVEIIADACREFRSSA
jgi:glutamate-1-semialdehyde 2,1-aminomutase